ncbi:hypothetical protein GCM10011378_29130 [Hymenobacter glacieicola]|uniref:Uncharacterized protein n=1 Tax=Hymenobacter glacieicola TaxID=1562124 RepID=A0ABQ1WYP1_9BACT|nr:hypothetical protein GCM10011378_29130 [Hymenobacter glacieicola]
MVPAQQPPAQQATLVVASGRYAHTIGGGRQRGSEIKTGVGLEVRFPITGGGRKQQQKARVAKVHAG